MSSITIEEAQSKLSQLLEEMLPGQEVVITKEGQPWAQVKKSERTTWPCKAGAYRKPEFWMAADFDAPLEDFKEHME
jgi:antitoxin (DNA-binding transcriptional repressor) of toxin-antitoxin stability system